MALMITLKHDNEAVLKIDGVVLGRIKLGHNNRGGGKKQVRIMLDLDRRVQVDQRKSDDGGDNDGVNADECEGTL